jgi:hypothetical protein
MQAPTANFFIKSSFRGSFTFGSQSFHPIGQSDRLENAPEDPLGRAFLENKGQSVVFPAPKGHGNHRFFT